LKLFLTLITVRKETIDKMNTIARDVSRMIGVNVES